MAPYDPPCPHFPDCFGCPLVGLPYPEQLRKKRQAVARALADTSHLTDVDVPPLVRSPRRLGYRGRVKLVVRRGKGGLLTGLYVPQSHRVVDTSRCPVHPEPVNRVVRELKKLIVKLGIPAYEETTDRGEIRYLDIRYSFWRREAMVTLVTRHEQFSQGRDLARALVRGLPFVTGVVQNVNQARGNLIWGERFRTLAGRDAIMERVGFVKLKYPAGAFSQANPSVARRLYETVLTMGGLRGQETVLDLYCGVGPISFYLATASRLVWGVEENPQAVTAAKHNARINGFHNCRFFAGDVAEKVNQARDSLGHIDLVVFNPPRKGLSAEALEAIGSLNAPKMIYVSCDPTTLARDLDRLVERGYRLVTLRPFDLLPQTEEVETVALVAKL